MATTHGRRQIGGADRYAVHVRSAICALLMTLCAAFPAAAGAQNPIVLENQHQGTSAWKIGTAPYRVADDVNGQIKGYASATSVNLGEDITFKVSVKPAQSYTIDIYRLGCYPDASGNCLGGRAMTQLGPVDGIEQPACDVDGPTGTNTGLTVCNWSGPTFTVPANWTSGIYLGVLTNQTGYQNYVPFVVRDDARRDALLYVQPVTTHLAYNNYPNHGSGNVRNGKSLYDNASGGAETVAGPSRTRAVKVSFDRPYPATGAPSDLVDLSSGWSWEEYFVRWAEKAGHDISYATSVDLHAEPTLARNHKGILSVGHDEYWSKQMFDNAEAARDAGVHLAFFGSNDVYWQVRFEQSGSGVPNRVMVSYKNSPNNTYSTNDPIADRSLATVRFQDPPVNRPAQTLLGTSFLGGTGRSTLNTDLIASDVDNWAFDGSGLARGDAARNLVGYEADAYSCHYPLPANRSYTLLTRSPFTDDQGYTSIAHSSLYQAPSGAWVFYAGTMSWSWALDRRTPTASLGLPSGWVDPRIQRVTSNLLDAFSGTTTPQPGTPQPPPPCEEDRQTTFEDGRLTGPPLPATRTGVDRVLGTGVTLETANPIEGTHSARVQNAGAAWLNERLTPTDDLTVAMSVRLNAIPTGDVRVMTVSSLIHTVGNLTLRSNGKLCLRSGTSWIGGSTTTACTATSLAVGTTYRVALHQVRGSGADAILEAFVAPAGSPLGTAFAKTSSGTWTTRADKLDFGAMTATVLDAVFDSVDISGRALSAPQVPQNLAATAMSSARIEISWQDVASETSYLLERDTAASFSSPTTISRPADSTTYIDTTVGPSTTYYYRLRAVNGLGPSDATSTVSATTSIAPPAAPSGLRATSDTATQTRLDWSDDSSDETGFVVELSSDRAFASVTAVTLASNTTTYTDTVVSEGPRFYRLKAINAAGESGPSAAVTNSRIKDITFEDGTSNLVNANTGVDRNPSGKIVLQSSSPLNGAYSAHVPGVDAAYLEQNFAAADDLYVSFYLRLGAIPASDMRVLQLLNGTSTVIGNLWVKTNGTLCLKYNNYWSAGSIAAACTPVTSPLVTGASYRIGLREKRGDGTSSATLEAFWAKNSDATTDPTTPMHRFSATSLAPGAPGYFTLPATSLRLGATLSTTTLNATFDDIKLDRSFMPAASPAP